jgi:hypothetical protein
MENQMSMKQDISDLKQKLLNPYDGLVVETRKNTEHRLAAEREDGDFEKIVDEHRELMQWKANITKVFWAILTGLGGLLTFFITQLAEVFKN